MNTGLTCGRCGKQKILLKTWKENVETISGTSELTYSQFVCPDADCQKLSDEALHQKRLDNQAREQMALEREQARIESRTRSLKNLRKPRK